MANRPELWKMPTPDAYANRSGARVRSAYDASVGAANRNLSRMGINPNSGRFAGTRAMLSRDQAADVAGAQQEGYTQGQEANAQYSLQRDQAVRSWAQLALQQRNASFSQRMAKKGFRLDQERHGLDMERGRFDLGNARTAAQRQDEAWNWLRQDREYETGIPSGATGAMERVSNQGVMSREQRMANLATNNAAQARETAARRGLPMPGAGTMGGTRGEDRAWLNTTRGWAEDDRAYNIGKRAWEAEDRADSKRLLGRKERIEDEQTAIGDMSQAQQMMRYIDTGGDFTDDQRLAIQREYDALREKNPSATETRLLLEAAKRAGVNLGGFEAWKAGQGAAAKGTGRRSPLGGGDFVKGQEEFWTSWAINLGYAKDEIYDAKGGLTRKGRAFLDSMNAIAARAPEGTTEGQILHAAAAQAGLLTEQRMKYEAPARKLQEQIDALDPKKDKKEIARLRAEQQEYRDQMALEAMGPEEQTDYFVREHEAATKAGDKKRLASLEGRMMAMKKRDVAQKFATAKAEWATMTPEEQRDASEYLATAGVSPHVDMDMWWEDKDLTDEMKQEIVYRVLSGKGTFAQAAESLKAKREEAKRRRFKPSIISTFGTVYDKYGDAHWDGSGN